MQNNSKLKNVIIVNDFNYTQGGATKVAIDTANLLVKSNSDINVFFFSASLDKPDTLDKRIINVSTNQGEVLKDKNKVRGFINGIYNFKAKKEFKKLLKSLNRDETIIHVHGWTKCLSSSVFDIAFKMKFKVVLTLHDYFTACPNGGYFNYKQNKICKLKPLSMKCIRCNCDSRNYGFKIYRLIRQFVQNKIVKLNKKIAEVITISDFSENILKDSFNNANFHRLYNPIELDNSNNKIDFENNEYYLYVGRISKEKGVDIFCEALTKLNKDGIVVGDGDERGYLQNKYSKIKFVGWKNSTEVKSYMRNAKAMIFTSKWYETAGLTVLEAISCGLPVIVASNTAATEFITNKEQVFENSNVNNLIEIIKNNNIRKEEKLDLKNFSFNRYIEKLNYVYNDIIK